MDARRFDRLAKSLAAWTSRRRFLTGVAGGAAGGLLGASRGRALEETPTPDPDVLDAIATMSAEVLPRLDPMDYAAEPSDFQVTPSTPCYPGQQFDPVRLPEFVTRLQALVQKGTEANQWDSAQLQCFLDTIALIPLAVSAGADADVFLDQYAVLELDPKATPPATPAVRAACIPLPPIRPETCTATCLDVWRQRQQEATSTNNIALMVEAFVRFLECFLLWGTDPTDPTECLAPQIPDACIPRILRACRGNCG